jgi:DNA-directed RNA polymerase specialized sigma24 family protein
MTAVEERSERLLVLLLLQSLKDASLQDKVLQLNIAGFSNIEIAEFLQISPEAVVTLLHKPKSPFKAPLRKK